MERATYLSLIDKILNIHPVCAILGPRQVGKTTLARQYCQGRDYVHFDLEKPSDLARLENAEMTLSRYQDKLIVIDEIQRRPELFPLIRVLVDEEQAKRRFLVLGSASRELIRQSSETLTGRIGHLELPPFSLNEVGEEQKLWLRGGFPRSFLATDDESSFLWRQEYISTFLERDLPLMGFSIPPEQLRRFWMMLVHYHGQIFKSTDIASSLGVSHHTVRKYLDILVGTFMVRLLPAWFENLSKRQVKSPKVYFRDSGILHGLLGIQTEEELHLYPRLGAYWEGFALENLLREIGARTEECYFWSTQSGAELDLLWVKGGKKIGFEFKYTDGVKITPSMKHALQDLSLEHLYVIYPGKESYPIHDKITVRPLK